MLAGFLLGDDQPGGGDATHYEPHFLPGLPDGLVASDLPEANYQKSVERHNNDDGEQKVVQIAIEECCKTLHAYYCTPAKLRL